MSDLFSLTSDNRHEQAGLLQSSLVELIDLSLVLKQAHWNLVGAGFLSIHEQLDAILADVRSGADEIAERIVALGHSADGRARSVVEWSKLPSFPEGILTVEAAARHSGAMLGLAIDGMRRRLARLGELDPVSEDVVIGVLRSLEKHHWMLRAHLETPDRRAGHG